MRKLFLVAALLGCMGPAHAQYDLFGDDNSPLYSSKATATKEGFTFSATGSDTKITIIRPDIFVGEQSTGGIARLNASWTENGRAFLESEMNRFLKARGFAVSNLQGLGKEEDTILAEYRALFKLVSNAAIRNDLFPAKALPTKKGKFNWSLGTGVSKLRKFGNGGDYGLFLFSHDSYGLPGRKALEIIGLAKGIQSAPAPHYGYAGLVDLKSGDLVWLNVNVRLGEDIRKPDGARRRVEKLLTKFPKKANGSN